MARANLLGNIYLGRRIIEPPNADPAYGTIKTSAQSIAGLESALSTAGYTADQVALMSPNDMIFALRIKNGVQI